MLEDALRRSMIIFDGNGLVFFQRPISAGLLGLAGLVLFSSLFTKKNAWARKSWQKKTMIEPTVYTPPHSERVTVLPR